MNKIILILLFLSFIILSCETKNIVSKKPFFDSKGNYVGDSIFLNDLIDKITFADSTYIIDSIVFKRYADYKKHIQSIYTFKGGKNIFENIEYYTNGNMRKYAFIDEDNESYFYQRNYDTSGKLIDHIGEIFFQGYIEGINSETLEVKRNTTIKYNIFYPNPPDCVNEIYIKDNDKKHKVFKKSKVLGFLQYVYQDNDKLGNFTVDVGLEIRERGHDSVSYFNKPLFFKVVE